MPRTESIIGMSLLCATVVIALKTRTASAQVDFEVVVSPPAAYIASTEPEYFDDRPVYFYNNYWYYRDRDGGWSYYRTEPAYLRERRGRWGWHGNYGRAGYDRGGYERGGYERGGAAYGHDERGGYARGGYDRGGAGYGRSGGVNVRGRGYQRGGGGRTSGPARYHYRR